VGELSIMELVFWALMVLMAYTLNGYPVLLSLFSRLKREREFPPAGERPMVSFIVAAYNEENNIRDKLNNLAAVDYDDDKIEFIIGSDASTDGTDEILRQKAEDDPRFSYFRLDQRSGKIAVLRRAVEKARGEILVFTDCSVRTDADIMPVILSSFRHPDVGLVSSRDIWVQDGGVGPAGQHDYIDYDMRIRRRESRLNSLVSASGSFFAVRRELFQPYGDDQADDFALSLMVYRRGYKVIHRDDLIGYVPMVKSSGAELSRRSRIVQAGIRTVLANLGLLNPFRYPVYAWQLWSHKALKWLFPFMALAGLVLAMILWNEGLVYRLVVFGYIAVIVIGTMGLAVRSESANRSGSTAVFLLLSSAAVLIAWYKVIIGARAKTWEPSHR
jgi:cellulose synthase/poly-beta-1,6-N-acetylglucosamine synthase-like glycosyltransferase